MKYPSPSSYYCDKHKATNFRVNWIPYQNECPRCLVIKNQKAKQEELESRRVAAAEEKAKKERERVKAAKLKKEQADSDLLKSWLDSKDEYLSKSNELKEKVKSIIGIDYIPSHAISLSTKIVGQCSNVKHGLKSRTVKYIIDSGGLCSVCGMKRAAKKNTIPSKEWERRFRDAHGDRYDYSKCKGNIIGANDKVDIICRDHGVWSQRVSDHANGKGCPYCNASDSDLCYIMIIENKNGIECIKYGITKTPHTRLSQINSGLASGLTASISDLWVMPTPQFASFSESKVKREVEPFMTKDKMADGFTETCDKSHYAFIITVYRKYGTRKDI